MTALYWTVAVLFSIGTLMNAKDLAEDLNPVGGAISIAVNLVAIWLLVHAAVSL